MLPLKQTARCGRPAAPITPPYSHFVLTATPAQACELDKWAAAAALLAAQSSQGQGCPVGLKAGRAKRAARTSKGAASQVRQPQPLRAHLFLRVAQPAPAA